MFAGLHCSGVEPRVGARSPLQYSAEGSASNYYNARLYSDADNLLGEPLYYTLEVSKGLREISQCPWIAPTRAFSLLKATTVFTIRKRQYILLNIVTS